MKHKRLLLALGLMIIGLGATMNVLANRVDIGALSNDYTIQDGDTLYGSMPASNEWYLHTLDEDVTLYLEDVMINDSYTIGEPGIACHGNATIVLIGTNEIYGHKMGYPAISIPKGYNLTITGEGELYASAGLDSWSDPRGAPGIGNCDGLDCGNIHITGECKVDARGGDACPGIGGAYMQSCGTITIDPSCYYVFADGGGTAPGSIGKASGGSCAGVTICGKNYGDLCSTDPFEYYREVSGNVDGINYQFDTYAKEAFVQGGTFTTTVTIPASVEYNSEDYKVTKILSSAFYNADGVTEVILPEGLKVIEYLAFLDCDNLGDIAIPSTVTKIEPAAFKQNKKMANITVHADNPNYCDVDGVLFSKDKKALLCYPCARTEDLYNIPEGVEAITMSAFHEATNLEAVVFPEGLTSIGAGAFRECPLLETLTFPSTLVYIDEDAFYACPKITDVYLQNTAVETIGHSAFASCTDLTNLVLPESLTYIDDHAFYYCTKLKYVTCLAMTPPKVSIDVFTGIASGSVLTVPYATSLVYKAIPEWSVFSDVEEYLPSEVLIDGINYNLYDDGLGTKTAKVLPYPVPGEKYKGVITIPATVQYHGVDFNVTSIGESAFNGCMDLTAVTLPDGLEAIWELAFASCMNLTSITLPDGLLGIGYCAFSLSGLTSVNIPASVTSLHSTAFQSCFYLTEINVDPANGFYASEDGVLFNSMMDELFTYPAGNERPVYTMPSSVTDMDERAFAGAGYLEHVVMSTSLTNIPAYAFLQSGLKVIELPASITYVGESAFGECDGVNRIICQGAIPPSLDVNVFYGIDKDIVPVFVPNANIGDYNTTAGWDEFTNFYGLDLPEKQIDGVWYHFNLSYGTAVVIANPDGLTKYDGNVTIPDKVNSYDVDFTVNAIGNEAFNECDKLTAVTLPSTIETIGISAFAMCSGLTGDLVLPDGLRIIDVAAFFGCTEISTVTIPKSVELIDDNAFNACLDLTDINVDPANVTYASEDGVLYSADKTVLLYCPNGREGKLTIPDGVKTIGEEALYYCWKLLHIYVPASVEYIDDMGFAQCGRLKSIEVANGTPIPVGSNVFLNAHFDEVVLVVPGGAEDNYVADAEWGQFKHILGDYYFHEEDGILYNLYPGLRADVAGHPSGYEGDIVIPASVTWGQPFDVISAPDAFANCPKLTSVSLPASVTMLDARDFANSPKLTAIDIDFMNTKFASVDGVVFSKDMTTLVVYPIGKPGPFAIPDGVATIKESAFESAAELGKVTIPESVTTIADYAFKNAALDTIVCEALTPPALGTNVFENLDVEMPVYVHASALAAYKGAPGWDLFKKYITIEDQAAADAAIAKIDAIGTVEYTPACKDKIDAAREAYDKLTDGGKALVSAAKYGILTKAEEDYAALKKAAEDKEAADAVILKIDAIGVVELSGECKGRIDDARDAYDALTTDQKALITAEKLKVLTDAEEAYAALKAAAKAVVDKIAAIGIVEYTTASKDIIDAARSAYDLLSDAQKALVSNYTTLTEAEAAYADLKAAAEKAAADKEAAKAVEDKITAIGTVEYTEECKNNIDAAREAYDKLTEDQKPLVSNYAVLTMAESYYELLKANAEAADDAAAAKVVIDAINAIGTVEYTDECKGKIEAARAAYEALNDTRKALVTNLSVLTKAEEDYAALKKAAEDAAAAIAAAKVELNKAIAELTALKSFAETQLVTDVAAALGTAIKDAKDVVDDEDATLEQVNAATSTSLKALDDASAAIIKEARDRMKAELDALLKPGDSEACKKIVDDAKDAIDALTTDPEAGVDENLDAITKAGKLIYDKAEADLIAQRASEIPTGFENIEQPSLVGQKVLRDGHVFILVGDKMYDAAGRLVK